MDLTIPPTTAIAAISLKWNQSFFSSRKIYFFIFTLSGFAGLIYESIWTHYLKLFLGHAAYAQTLVLCIFMGGMAAGAWLASRYSKTWRSPLLVYAIVEIAIGLAAIYFHTTFTSVVSFFYQALLPAFGSTVSPIIAHLAKWILAALLIIPQSILLGMTFPLMTSGVMRKYPGAPGNTIALLYFTNSIGAAVGVLVSGFWLIKIVGLPGTTAVAGAINVFLGVLVWGLYKADSQPYAPILSEQPLNKPSSSIKWFLVAAFITGVASFIYEITWIRMLSLVLGSATHSFELMLSAFISGIALGGLWIRHRIDTIKNPIRFSAYVQILMGLLALLTIPLYSLTFDWMSYFMGGLALTDNGYTLFSLASHGITLGVMLPTTFLAGMTLPLFTYVLLKEKVGEKSIGQVYAANTLGAIAGILIAVHIGLPLLGLKYSLLLGVLLDIALGLFLLSRSGGQYGRRQIILPLLLCSLAVVGITSTSSFSLHTLTSSVFRYGNASSREDDDFFYYKDGKTSSVALFGDNDGIISIANNGKSDASVNMNPAKEPTLDEPTMILAGSLPLAYKPDARSVANIGLGSGLTTHTLLAAPQLERVDTIEIEPAIVEAAKGFGQRVERVYEDPRSHIHIEDAKTFFPIYNRRYDMIISEPSNPWVSGVSSLFTQEFYAQIKPYMADDGIFVQWLQLYEMQTPLAASVIKALSANFSDFVIYNTVDYDILIIAKKQGQFATPQFEHLFQGAMKKDLDVINVHSEADMNLRFIGSKALLETFFYSNHTSANSDYFPVLDLYAGKARYLNSLAKGLADLPQSPFPTLEYFNKNQPEITTPASKSVGLTRSSRARDAQIILQQLTSTSKKIDIQAVTDDRRGALHFIRLMAAQCDWNNSTTDWLQHFHRLMASTLPELSKADAKQLFAKGIWKACPTSKQVDLWLSFYQAIAHRDTLPINRLGRKILRSEKELDRPRSEYVLGATMLSFLEDNNALAAQQLWQTYAVKVYDWEELPETLIYRDNVGAPPAFIVLIVNAMQQALDDRPDTEKLDPPKVVAMNQ